MATLANRTPETRRRRASPRLDPESVLRAGERRRLHRHVPDLPLAGAPAEAADADPVPGAAPDVADSHARGARPHGDAVVAGAHRRAEDGDVAGQRDVDAVGVELSAGAAIRKPCSVTPAQSKMETCTFLLSTSVTRFTDTLFDWLMSSV